MNNANFDEGLLIKEVLAAKIEDGNVIVKAIRRNGEEAKRIVPITDPDAMKLYDAASAEIEKQNAAKVAAAGEESIGEFIERIKAEEDKKVADKRAQAANNQANNTITMKQQNIDPETGKYTYSDVQVEKPQREAKTTPVEPTQDGASKVEKIEKKDNSRFYKGLVLGVLGTVGIGAVAYLSGCGKEDDLNKGQREVIEADQADEVVDQTVEVTNLTAEDVKSISNVAIQYYNDELGLKIAPEAIQALTFMMNQQYINPEEAAQLISEGFIPDDARDMMATSLPATSTINNNNAMAMFDGREIATYSVLTPDSWTLKLSDAFDAQTKELAELCAVLDDANATKEEKEAAAAEIEAIWTSFEAYGGLNSEETTLPMNHQNSGVPGEFVSLQYLLPYREAAGRVGVAQSRLTFASGEGKDASVVFVDFSSMYNTIEKNLGLACEVQTPTTR